MWPQNRICWFCLHHWTMASWGDMVNNMWADHLSRCPLTSYTQHPFNHNSAGHSAAKCSAMPLLEKAWEMLGLLISNTIPDTKNLHHTGSENTVIPHFKMKITEKIVQYCNTQNLNVPLNTLVTKSSLAIIFWKTNNLVAFVSMEFELHEHVLWRTMSYQFLFPLVHQCLHKVVWHHVWELELEKSTEEVRCETNWDSRK